MADPIADAEYERVRQRAARASALVDLHGTGAPVLLSPNGTRYRLSVDDAGALAAVSDADPAPQPPASAGPVDPPIGSMTAPTSITITRSSSFGFDGDNPLDSVAVRAPGGGYLLWDHSPQLVNDHTVTATIPAGSTNAGVQPGVAYDIEVDDVNGAVATFAGAFVLSPLDPASGSMTAATDVTLTDANNDFTLAAEVDILAAGGATLLTAPITGSGAGSLTATVPAGSSGAGVTAGTPYDVQVVVSTPKGGNTYVTYNGSFRFTA